MRGIRITGEPPKDWLDDAKEATAQLRTAAAVSVNPDVYKLQLLPNLSTATELPDSGESLLVIAELGTRLHVRAFDDESTKMADTLQPKKDDDRSPFNELAGLLRDNWDITQLKSIEIKEVFRLAENIIRRHRISTIIKKKDGMWTDDRVRDWLLAQFNNKCWYSEAQEAVSSIHVDHFRPKGRVRDNETKELCEGYWWLAFDWRNYRISGQLVNVKKSDLFPHLDSMRARHDDEDSLDKECPSLLDPICDEEARLISYDWQDADTCTAVPAGGVSDEDAIRVETTVDVLGLNRLPRLNAKRAQAWSKCRAAIDKYEAAATGPRFLAKLTRAMAKVELKRMITYDSEFSSISEACIRKHAPESLLGLVFAQG